METGQTMWGENGDRSDNVGGEWRRSDGVGGESGDRSNNVGGEWRQVRQCGGRVEIIRRCGGRVEMVRWCGGRVEMVRWCGGGSGDGQTMWVGESGDRSDGVGGEWRQVRRCGGE